MVGPSNAVVKDATNIHDENHSGDVPRHTNISIRCKASGERPDFDRDKLPPLLRHGLMRRG
jgi:hypothetical protein